MKQEGKEPLLSRTAKAIGDYFAKHWHGDFSLHYSYWVNFILPLVPLGGLVRFVYYMRASETASAAGENVLLGAVFLLGVCFITWSLGGLWRSAGKRIAKDGSPQAYAARGLICLIVSVFLLGSGFAAAAVAVPDFNWGRRVVNAVVHGYAVFGRRRVVSFSGRMTDRAVGEVRAMLTARGSRVLALTDANGSLEAALELAKYVRENNITVYVNGRCGPACAVVLAAAPSRVVKDEAKVTIGIPGEETSSREMRQAIETYYAEAGASEDMLSKLFAPGDARVMRTSLQMLASEGIATHVMGENQTVVPAADWCSAHADACNGP